MAESSSIILKSPHDWDAWNKKFRAVAMSKRLYNKILGNESFLTPPTMPNPGQYPTRRGIRSIAEQLAEPATTLTTAAEPAENASTNTSVTAASTPAAIPTPAITTADLTSEGR